MIFVYCLSCCYFDRLITVTPKVIIKPRGDMSVNTGAPSPAAQKRHALAFILLLLSGAFLGAFYKPSPSALSSRDSAGEEFQIATLPALPGWANAPLPAFSSSPEPAVPYPPPTLPTSHSAYLL